jgi:hypothetical protein
LAALRALEAPLARRTPSDVAALRTHDPLDLLVLGEEISRVSLKGVPAVAALHGLHPEVVQDGALDAPLIDVRVQRTKGSTHRPLKFLQRIPKVRQRFHLQLEPCDCTCNGIDVYADDSGAKPARFHDGRSAAHEGVEDGESPQVRSAVIAAPEVLIGIGDSADQKGSENAAKAPSKPFVSGVDGPRPVPFANGELCKLPSRKRAGFEQ